MLQINKDGEVGKILESAHSVIEDYLKKEHRMTDEDALKIAEFVSGYLKTQE